MPSKEACVSIFGVDDKLGIRVFHVVQKSGSSIISLAAFASSDPLRSHNDVGFSGQLEAVWPGTHPMVLNLHLDGFSSPRSFGVLA